MEASGERETAFENPSAVSLTIFITVGTRRTLPPSPAPTPQITNTFLTQEMILQVEHERVVARGLVSRQDLDLLLHDHGNPIEQRADMLIRPNSRTDELPDEARAPSADFVHRVSGGSIVTYWLFGAMVILVPFGRRKPSHATT